MGGTLNAARAAPTPLASRRALGCFVGRRLLLLLSYVTLPRGARSFFCAGFVKLRWLRVEAGAWKRVLGGWD